MVKENDNPTLRIARALERIASAIEKGVARFDESTGTFKNYDDGPTYRFIRISNIGD